MARLHKCLCMGEEIIGGGLWTLVPAIVSDQRVSVPNVPPLLVSPPLRGLVYTLTCSQAWLQPQSWMLGVFVETVECSLALPPVSPFPELSEKSEVRSEESRRRGRRHPERSACLCSHENVPARKTAAHLYMRYRQEWR